MGSKPRMWVEVALSQNGLGNPPPETKFYQKQEGAGLALRCSRKLDVLCLKSGQTQMGGGDLSRQRFGAGRRCAKIGKS